MGELTNVISIIWCKEDLKTWVTVRLGCWQRHWAGLWKQPSGPLHVKISSLWRVHGWGNCASMVASTAYTVLHAVYWLLLSLVNCRLYMASSPHSHRVWGLTVLLKLTWQTSLAKQENSASPSNCQPHAGCAGGGKACLKTSHWQYIYTLCVLGTALLKS